MTLQGRLVEKRTAHVVTLTYADAPRPLAGEVLVRIDRVLGGAMLDHLGDERRYPSFSPRDGQGLRDGGEAPRELDAPLRADARHSEVIRVEE
jgi:hypothetical protein